MTQVNSDAHSTVIRTLLEVYALFYCFKENRYSMLNGLRFVHCGLDTFVGRFELLYFKKAEYYKD